MNFWTWLDRNGHGVAVTILILACLAMPVVGEAVTGHKSEGCHVRCGDGK
jgi:hypothetical protein